MAKSGTKRIVLLDEVRGFAIICMVFFHAFYMMAYMFGWSAGTALFGFFAPAEPWFAGLFIFISGICGRLSHSNADRGAKLLWVAIALTVVTWILDYICGMSGTVIWFGILHLLALAMLFYAATAKVIDRIPAVITVIVFAVLFVLTYGIGNGAIGIGSLSWPLPAAVMRSEFLFPFGIVTNRFYSADYFPLLPWLFLFVAGTAVGARFADGRIPKWFYSYHGRPVAFCGRHSLLIYLAHQPVIYIILLAISRIFGI